jgi:chemosensory pili system protein ChpA (sensor histidine kinase/response regulator)
VVRPLPALLKNHPFCCGATLSGFGQTVLVLDARRLVQSQQHQLRRDDAANCVAEGAGVPQRGTGKPRPRVLVADDSGSARLAAVRSLARYALDITQASDGKQASELLGSEHFDAVFTDLEMPHFSGLELLEQLKTRCGENAPPLVIISSRHEAQFTSEAERLGAAGYLVKPLTDEALDQVLAACPALQRLTTQTSHSTSSGETQ